MKSPFTRSWIIENGIPIAESYNGNITLRALHYRLVSIGMTNDLAHYKRVVTAMIDARWSGEIAFDAFLDHERETIGSTDYDATDVGSKVSEAKHQIKLWAESYRKNRWENQPIYPEVFIEKKALIGVFESPCREARVALNPCKGYPSLTFLYDASERFKRADRDGKIPVILYFGDYDPSGEDIPRSISDNLSKLGIEVDVRRIALSKEQVIKMKLPPAPTKITDSRSAKWDGLGQVELDAIDPKRLSKMCSEAIDSVFNKNLHDELMAIEEEETNRFKQILREDFNSLLD